MASEKLTIAGGGIFGLACAWELLRRGQPVRVIEAAQIGAGASGGHVGALAPHAPENWNAKKQVQLEALIAAPDRSLTMNCGYGRGFSVLEVLDAVDRVTNRTITRIMGPRRAGDPDSLISDNRLIRQTLPWQPRYADLDTIIGHAMAWERKLTEIRAQG